MSKIVAKEWSWDMTLWEFLSMGNYPQRCDKWKDFFIKHSELLYRISEELTRCGKNIYPPIHQVFRAFIPLEKIRVVILGQDPYHNGSAVGLAFSVLPGNRINPSLRNIYKELRDEGYSPKEDGSLSHWVEQGCMLLNTALTVERGDPGVHIGIWYDFSVEVIKYISTHRPDCVWLLMGAKAYGFSRYISQCISQGNIFVTSHPSPFSAHCSMKGFPAFLGSGIFRRINNILGEKAISW